MQGINASKDSATSGSDEEGSSCSGEEETGSRSGSGSESESGSLSGSRAEDLSESLSAPPGPPESIVPPPEFANDPMSSSSDDSSLPPPPEVIEQDSKKISMETVTTTDESDLCDLSGQHVLPNGNTIDKNSAAFLPKSKKDPDDEDEYGIWQRKKNIADFSSHETQFSTGYTLMKVQRKYAKFSHQPDGSRGQLLLVSLNKGTSGLGISLAGHKDRFRIIIIVNLLNVVIVFIVSALGPR